MNSLLTQPHLRRTAFAFLAGLVAAIAVMLAPVALVERLVTGIGLAHIPWFAPPLGEGARSALAFAAALAVEAAATYALMPRRHRVDARMMNDDDVDVAPVANGPSWIARLRAAVPWRSGRVDDHDDAPIAVPFIKTGDRHPDAPPRAPLRATIDLPGDLVPPPPAVEAAAAPPPPVALAGEHAVPTPVTAVSEPARDADDVPVLLDRLEAAMARRRLRQPRDVQPLPALDSELRTALGHLARRRMPG